MTGWGFDVDSYNKDGFNFAQAYQQGYRIAWIKFGGMNMSGNRPYRMSGYQAFVNAAFDAGFPIVGDYILTGGSDPVGAAEFYLANRDPRITRHFLDNEKIDYGSSWNDGQACAYFDTIGSSVDRFQYGSRDSLWNAQQWPGLQQRGIKAIIALYNGAPFTNTTPRTYPASLVKGHQWTSSASIGGLAADADAFTDDAFSTFASPTLSQGDDVIIYRAQSASADGVILSGISYIQEGNGPLRAISADEAGAYAYWNKPPVGSGVQAIPTRYADWSGDSIRTLSHAVGVLEVTSLGAGDLYPQFSGKVVYADPANPVDPRANVTVEGTSTDLTTVNADLAAIKAAIAGLPTQWKVTTTGEAVAA